jgi:hypothetical protein
VWFINKIDTICWKRTEYSHLIIIAVAGNGVVMAVIATFNNTFCISVISWQSVLLVEETGGPGENHRPVASHSQTLSHNVVHLTLIEIRTYK